MNLAPIALFVYNRPWHTKQTIEALKKNELAKESKLYIFSDGPKKNELDIVKVGIVRNYIKTISGFRNVEIVEQKENRGLAQSIISGVTDIVNRHGHVIVLEDDLVTSPYFLKYMNEALEIYRDRDDVASIHGYIYPTKVHLPETFFIKGADCWGWATWQRAWNMFEPDGKKLLAQLQDRKLEKEFNFDDSHDYIGLLEGQINDKNDSWAIRWYASAFLQDKLTLYPGKSLIKNIGLDNTGTHSGESNVYNVDIANRPINLSKIQPVDNREAREAFGDFFRSIKPSLYGRVIKKVKRLKKTIRKLAKSIVPPLILNAYCQKKNKYGYFGDYKTWREARNNAKGYDSDTIIEKVKKSALEVRKGLGAYERDGVLFKEIEHSWPLLAILLWISSKSENKLNLMDFGGALGTSYIQNKDFFDKANLQWSIVEQKKFADYGKKFFEDKCLKFYYTPEECFNDQDPNTILLSSVIQYLEKPYELLEQLIDFDPEYIIFDKTPFNKIGRDIITVQKVPKHIYNASYPSWIFDYKKFINFMSQKYELVSKFNEYQEDVFQVDNTVAEWKGLFFKKKHENNR